MRSLNQCTQCRFSESVVPNPSVSPLSGGCADCSSFREHWRHGCSHGSGKNSRNRSTLHTPRSTLFFDARWIKVYTMGVWPGKDAS
jgi:hypothetical protein